MPEDITPELEYLRTSLAAIRDRLVAGELTTHSIELMKTVIYGQLVILDGLLSNRKPS